MNKEETKGTDEVVENENIEAVNLSEKSENSEAKDSIDLSALDTESLLSNLESLLNTIPIQSMKPKIDEAKKIFYERSNEAYKKALEKFKAEQETEGEEDAVEFEYIYPHTEAFKQIISNYKKRRNAYYNDLDKQLSTKAINSYLIYVIYFYHLLILTTEECVFLKKFFAIRKQGDK